jgi:hypothetical protein
MDKFLLIYRKIGIFIIKNSQLLTIIIIFLKLKYGINELFLYISMIKVNKFVIYSVIIYNF